MPSNERQNARKAKKQKAQQRTKKIIWFIIIFVSVALIAMRVAEIDFSALKSKYFDKDGKISVSVDVNSNMFPYNLDSSRNVKAAVQNDKLSVLTSVSCTVLNPTDGVVSYTFSHGYANPIMKNAGNYICLFDQGANRLRLDNLNENVYEIKSDTSVLCANVSRNGNVVYAVTSDENKSSVIVTDSKLKEILRYDVNSGYVVAVAIDDSGKKIAFAVVNSKDAQLFTTVYTMNVGDKEPRAEFEYADMELRDLRYCSSELYVVGSDTVSVISSQKKQKEVFEKGSVNTVCYNYTSNGELVLVYAKYSSANENSLVHINSSGKVNTVAQLSQKPKYVSSASNEICVLYSDNVSVYSLTKGELKETYHCDDSISSVNKLSTKLFVCRHQLIDVLEK